jgi:hypothetical protein
VHGADKNIGVLIKIAAGDLGGGSGIRVELAGAGAGRQGEREPGQRRLPATAGDRHGCPRALGGVHLRLDSDSAALILSGMWLRLRKKPPAASLERRRGLKITVLAHNRALHYLASHPLTADERAQLTEVAHGYTGPCDILAAREGLAWLRERYRERGEHPPF